MKQFLNEQCSGPHTRFTCRPGVHSPQLTRQTRQETIWVIWPRLSDKGMTHDNYSVRRWAMALRRYSPEIGHMVEGNSSGYPDFEAPLKRSTKQI